MRQPIPFLAVALASLVGFAGCSAPSFLVTPVSAPQALKEEVVQEGKGWFAPKVAIIEVEGMLMNGRKTGLLSSGENELSRFAQALEMAERDDEVKAVVLRINSPGGTVTASDTMYQMIRRFKAKTHKPVVASTQEVAASGAYYVACAADKIVAQPTSVVGSIGVIFEGFDVSQGLASIGVYARTVHTGTLKQMGSPFKTPTPEELAAMQEMVDEYYVRFSQVVKENRPAVRETPPPPPATQPASYAGVFSGRVFSGSKAVELGLVDQTGLLNDALDLARKMAHAENAKAVMYKRPYGYTGSIYASNETPKPASNVLELSLPGSGALLPTGFYYLWQP